ncbi:MAG: DUF983 domain-containing protein [Pseudomonadota bacterium]
MELVADRNTKQAMIRGFKRTCPRCGQGHLFNGYLSVAKTCGSCGLDLTPQRADDGPAYLTIVIVGHLLVPLLVPAYMLWDLHPTVMATLFSALTVALSLYILPRLKGALIGFQWAKRMHGF